MSIQKLRMEDHRQAKELWKSCFFDSDSFLEVYLKEAANFKNTLAYYKEDEILADLFMLEFCAKVSGTSYQTDFLAGCATRKDARNKGYMRQLVKEALKAMQKEGMCVTFLHPFLHAFYRKFGYETISYVTRHKQTADAKKMMHKVRRVQKFEDFPLQKAQEAYDKMMKKYDNCFLRTPERFSVWIKLLYADDGEAVMIEHDGEVSYALYYETQQEIDIFELVCQNHDERLSLINYFDKKQVNYSLPAEVDDKDGEEFTMMRVINPIPLLKNKIFEDCEFILHITDDFLQQTYNLQILSKNGITTVKSTLEQADFSVDIGNFAKIFTGAANKTTNIEILRLFKRESSCFFETY
ncbi:MAG: GNAT family N-acetyltransferase [Christensenellaceae bacterium]